MTFRRTAPAHDYWRGLAEGRDLPDLEQLLRRPEWHARAACRGMGTRLFFPPPGNTPARPRQICARCEVRDQCLAEAEATGVEYGIWGGLLPGERKALSSSAAAPAFLQATGR
jgi:WhiB family redox-sensing transcriptional regulator